MLDIYLEKLPGFTGELARFIHSKIDTNQPGLCIAAALSFVSAIKADRVFSSQYSTSCNLYCLAIAEAGVGKTTCQDILMELAINSGSKALLMGEPGTHQGIRTALLNNNRQFLQWDEFGHALVELTTSKNGNRMLILSLLMRIFSANGKVLLGTELKTEDKEDIEKPFLSVFAVSTPERFYEPLNEGFITDGLLPRWLQFPPEKKNVFKEQSFEKIPQEFFDMVRDWNLGELGSPDKGNMAEYKYTPTKLDLKFDPESFEEKKNCFRNHISKSKTSIERAFWRRGFEHTVKVAMTLAESRTCSEDDLDFAYSLVEALIKLSIASARENLYDSPQQRQESKDKELIMGLLAPGQSITRTQLTRAAHRIEISKRDKIVTDLCSTGTWTASQTKPITYTRSID